MLPVSKKYCQDWMPGFFNDFFNDEWMERPKHSIPAINVIENEHGFDLELAAPGMTRDDFKVSLDEEGDLVINMEKKEEKKEENKEEKHHGRYLRREFSYAKFQQTFVLPEEADKENITASVENGVLKVNIPKVEVKEIPQSKKMIEIK